MILRLPRIREKLTEFAQLGSPEPRQHAGKVLLRVQPVPLGACGQPPRASVPLHRGLRRIEGL
jgi:hypothetical protein